MGDTEAAGEENVGDRSEEKLKPHVKPHHTINEELDIDTPVYQR